MQSTVSERVVKLMTDEFRLNKPTFARQIGVPVTTIKSLKPEQEHVNSNIIAGIKKAYPKINLDWLVMGEGDIFLKDDVQFLEVPFIGGLDTNSKVCEPTSVYSTKIQQLENQIKELKELNIKQLGQIELLKEMLAKK
jgi:hypothetical protein